MTTMTSAARTQAWRRRRCEGTILVQLDVSAHGVQALQRLGWLKPGDERNPSAIGAAILALGSVALTKGLRPAESQRAPNGREP